MSDSKPERKRPSLTEARERWEKCFEAESRKELFGCKVGMHAEHELIEAVETHTWFRRSTDSILGEGRADESLHAQLGEWLADTIRKRKGSRLHNLAVLLSAERLPSEQSAPQAMQFLWAMRDCLWSGDNRGLKTTAERAKESQKGHLPTKGELRKLLGWDAKVLGKIAKRLGWNDLPEGRSGRPRKPSPAKQKMR